MNILLNSLHVLRQDSELILILAALVLWGSLICFAALSRTAPSPAADAALSALSLAGWPAPLLLLSLLLLALRAVLPLLPAVILTLLSAAACAIAAARSLRDRPALEAVVPLLLFVVLLSVRLGFAAGALLPPYFDSAEHYGIIQSLLELPSKRGLIWPAATYYHLGYHVVAAALVPLTGAPLARIMLVLGQFILAALPVPMYFFVRGATGSQTAALMGFTLAGLGWSMPAHAANWGKYPALMGLLLLQFGLGLAALNRRSLLIPGAVIAGLVHTRILVLFGLLALAWAGSRFRRLLMAGLSAAFLAVELILLLRDPALRELLAPYTAWATLLAVLLAALAIPASPRLVFACLLFVVLILGAALIPLNPALSLLDRPLAEMALFLPLAFLGGLGAATLPRALPPLLALAILVHAFTAFSFVPSECCRLAGADDVVAFHWMEANLRPGARIGIASEDLRLTSTGLPLQAAGSDGGIWIEPLTGLPTIRLSHLTDFSLAGTHQRLCRQGIAYLYVGGTAVSFNIAPALALAEWYKVAFSLPEARLVRVSGC
ncbi:MAG: hypothetical protein ACM3QS_07705 [Bacteroidota bacterium]